MGDEDNVALIFIHFPIAFPAHLDFADLLAIEGLEIVHLEALLFYKQGLSPQGRAEGEKQKDDGMSH
ncbi:hypothetical protein GCM10027098_34780 [Bowmanella dokdonensis]